MYYLIESGSIPLIQTIYSKLTSNIWNGDGAGLMVFLWLVGVDVRI